MSLLRRQVEQFRHVFAQWAKWQPDGEDLTRESLVQFDRVARFRGSSVLEFDFGGFLVYRLSLLLPVTIRHRAGQYGNIRGGIAREYYFGSLRSTARIKTFLQVAFYSSPSANGRQCSQGLTRRRIP